LTIYEVLLMKLCRFLLCLFAAFLLLAFVAPETSLATTRVVNPANSSCSASSTPPCYTSITTALSAAMNGDVIEIHPGTYTGTYTITQQLTIAGTETARSILSGGGAGPIFTVSGAANVEIRRLSFTSATIGILVQNSSSVTMTNNVFRVGTSGTGVVVESTSTAVVDNNTFHQNLDALTFASGTTVTIRNNIFSSNASTAVSTVAAAFSIHNNCYFSNNINGQLTTDLPTTDVTADPLFVSAGSADFHLRSGSLCIDAGNTAVGSDHIDSTTADIGAYGGPNSDTIPFPVSGLVAIDVSVLPPPYTAQLSWSANSCYQVSGYKIRYGTASGSYLPASDVGNVLTSPVAGLTAASAPTGVPVLTSDIANQTLLLHWTAGGVSGATGYKVRYDMNGPLVGATCPASTIPTPASPFVDVASVTSYNLTGLTNNTCYSLDVIPYTQQRYFFTVTAYYNPALESANSEEISLPIGGIAEGTASSPIQNFPEPITPFPNAPNNGCFIATAAYGHYSAPQVQALREFRDHYLMTNNLGRAFVSWYYRYGPIGAEFINTHAWLKPMVRITLLPAVGGALLLTQTSSAAEALFVIFFGFCLLCAILLYRERKKVV
jgi:hypothetical protein